MKKKDSDMHNVSSSTLSGDVNKRKRKGAPCRKDEQTDSNGLYEVESFSAKDRQDMASLSGSATPVVILHSRLLHQQIHTLLFFPLLALFSLLVVTFKSHVRTFQSRSHYFQKHDPVLFTLFFTLKTTKNAFKTN